jgi:hypothetical protein
MFLVEVLLTGVGLAFYELHLVYGCDLTELTFSL